MAKDAIYEGEREVRTFADLGHGVDVLIKKAEQDEEGSYYTIMGGLLLTAFTFEAYLNHLGDKRLSDWEKKESLKVMDKYSVLCKDLGITPEFSRRPYQTVKALFTFRNSIAHGKSQILKETKKVSSKDDPYQHSPKTRSEEYCTLKHAKRAKEDISEIIKELHREAGLGDYPFIHGATIGSLSLNKRTQ